ncbi:MAG: type II toxin-antitoxin system Phd/YefM family antitoxin [Azoarcus sp.]|jgi:prevent-host-death family protein|nr:type II toxin-antitoxin system Phd/YefM family antitoxin [Azoarcus sp.]
MPSTFTSRDFNREPGRIKRAAAHGPVVITERNKPALVVLAFTDYKKLAGKRQSLLDALSMPGLADIDFDPSLPPGFPVAPNFD